MPRNLPPIGLSLVCCASAAARTTHQPLKPAPPGLYEELLTLLRKYESPRSPSAATPPPPAPLAPADEVDVEPAPTHAFVPLASRPCFGQLPCLHTTARERLLARCDLSIWSGAWQDASPALNRSLQIGAQTYGVNGAGISNRYTPATSLGCDVADLPWASYAAAGESLNDARERHMLFRLRGLQHKLWLMIGNSVDHMNINVGCPLLFGVEKTSVLTEEEDFSGSDEHLTVDFCASRKLNFTMAYVFVDGFSTTAASRNRTARAAQLAGLDRVLRSLGWPAGPDFVTMSGLVWDFKHWIDAGAVPDFDGVAPAISMQIALVRQLWPRVKGIFLRTHFACHRSRHGRYYLTDQGRIDKYNGILRAFASKAAGPDLCGEVMIADMEKLMIHNGQRSTGWTDGIHPGPWVTIQYMRLLSNVLADLGEHCV